MKRAIVVVATASVVCPSGWAQLCESKPVTVKGSVTQSGDIASVFADPGAATQINATSDGGKAIVRVASSIESLPVGENCPLIPDMFVSKGWDMTLSAPLGDDNDARDFATLDGLEDDLALEVGFSRGWTFGFGSPQDILPALQKGLEVAHAACLQKQPTTAGLDCTKPGINDVDSNGNSKADAFVAAHAREYFAEQLTSNARTFWLRGSAKLGYESFDYIDASDLSAESSEEIEYSFGVSATYVTFERNLALTAGVAFESAFDEEDEAIVCIGAMMVGDAPNCASGRPGMPNREDSWKAHLEYRYLSQGFGFGGRNIGFAPRITRDFEKDITGINVPIFLVAPGDSGVTTGLNLGWRDDTDAVTAGLFVGGKFSLLGD